MAKEPKRALDLEEIGKPPEKLPLTPEEIASHRPEELFITYPEQLFSLAPYTSFRVGNISIKILTQPGESYEEAYERGWKFLHKMAQNQFQILKVEHENRLKGFQI